MRADRLLSILLLLQVHQRVTAQTLAQRLEVSQRTIYRDMEALSTAGVPVVAERGMGGGWTLMEDYQTKLTGLNEAEIQALFLASPSRLLNDLGLKQASESALIKLLAVLPSVHRQDAEYIRQRIYIETSGWRSSEESVGCFPVLQQAIWQEVKLKLSYQRSDEVIVERLVDPLGLVAKGSTWYLVAAIDGSLRSYRASRIQTAYLTDISFQRPLDFDLVEYWRRSMKDFRINLPRYPAIVRADPDILPQMRYISRYVTLEEPAQPYELDDQGWLRIPIQFESQFDAIHFVLGFGARIEALEPPELQSLVLAGARDILRSHEPPQGHNHP